MKMLQKKILEEARTWEGTPFQYGGYEKGKGTDCARLFLQIFKNVDLIRQGTQIAHLPPNWVDSKKADEYENVFIGEIEKFAKKVDNMQVTDLLLFRYHGRCSHLGMLFPEENILHARNYRKVQVQSIKIFRDKIAGIYRHRGIVNV